MAASAVPLMMDIEGVHTEGEEGDGEGIKNQFEYHNNVMGASKAVRLGICKFYRFKIYK